MKGLRKRSWEPVALAIVVTAAALASWGLSLMPECRTPIPLIWTFGIVVECWVAAVALVPATFFIGAVRMLDRAQR